MAVLAHDTARDLQGLFVVRVIRCNLERFLTGPGHIDPVALGKIKLRQQLLWQDQPGRIADLLDFELHDRPPDRCTFRITYVVRNVQLATQARWLDQARTAAPSDWGS